MNLDVDEKPSLSRRDTVKLALGGIASMAIARFAGAQSSSTETTLHATFLAGEPRPDAVVLQVRLASALPNPGDATGVAPGVTGTACFEVSSEPDFARPVRTAWVPVTESSDFIAKASVNGLSPGTRYHYRALFKAGDERTLTVPGVAQFRTLPSPSDRVPVSFAVFSCLSYELFYGLGRPVQFGGPFRKAAEGEARRRGYPTMDLIRNANPDFIVATGDMVYYDHPNSERSLWATNAQQMREKWQRQFALPAVREAFAASPAYFMKDDHDFRFDDADMAKPGLPTAADGARIFLEQVPLPAGMHTYRTHRVNRHLQIWLLEGRDHRSPNEMADGPGKSLWGGDQRRWLEETLLASDADFRVVISPTPIVGPDDERKSDNHASRGGFRSEGVAFLRFLQEKGLTRSTFIVNGDRHWKYHSIHPTGVEEFSCGTVHRQNSRPGVAPGDPSGTDPEGTIRQPYLQALPDGGFLQIDLKPDVEGDKATLLFRFFSESGDLQYAVRRFGNRPPVRRPGAAAGS